MKKEFLYLPLFLIFIIVTNIIARKLTSGVNYYKLYEYAVFLIIGVLLGLDARIKQNPNEKRFKIQLFAVVIPLAVVLLLTYSPYLIASLTNVDSIMRPQFFTYIDSAILLKTGLLSLGYFSASLKR